MGVEGKEKRAQHTAIGQGKISPQPNSLWLVCEEVLHPLADLLTDTHVEQFGAHSAGNDHVKL